jgi:hypothetical protein
MCFNRAPHHEGVLGSGGIALRILDLGTRWRWVVSFTPRPLYNQGKIPCYPLDRRLGGPQSRSGRGGEEKNSPLLPGLKLPDHPAHSPELYHWAISALLVQLNCIKCQYSQEMNMIKRVSIPVCWRHESTSGDGKHMWLTNFGTISIKFHRRKREWIPSFVWAVECDTCYIECIESVC